MEFDAIILAGGRSSRLGGTPKSELIYDGATLLDRSIAAARGARSIVVVGPAPKNLPAGVLSCREEPPFAGPAAAIAAGLARLQPPGRTAGSGDNSGKRQGADQDEAALTLVLACDMPRVADAVHALRDAIAAAEPVLSAQGEPGQGESDQGESDQGESGRDAAASSGGRRAAAAGRDGVMAASGDGRLQPLAGFYRTAALKHAVDDAGARDALTHGSVFALLARLDVQAVTVPAGSTDDVDTWDDAAALGVAGRE